MNSNQDLEFSKEGETEIRSSRFKIELTDSQQKAIFHIEGPLLVIAGPGSGKTRVITHRIAALIDSGVKPGNICAITFTNKAAEEMRRRANTFGVSAGAHISTFHSLCVRILRRYADKAAVSPQFSIYDESDQSRCIKQAVKDCELDTTNFPPARCLEAISSLKNKLIDAGCFKDEADDFFSVTLAKIYERYQHILVENDALDFDDLLMRTAFLLRDCPEVCSELSNRFRFLLIDEYQDTNHAQYVIAKALVCEHGNICVTGDPDQSIYRWRGADINNILDFENDWPDATVIKLEENFRSSPNILEVADKLISHNKGRKEKILIPTKAADRDVVVSGYEDELEESQAVAQQIEELVGQGASLKEIAVFYRVNAASRALEEAMIKHKVPYQIVRGVEFYRRKEIRDLLGYLKVLVNPNDEIALLRIVNTPARGIGKTTIDRVRTFAESHNISFYDALKKAEKIQTLSKAAKTKTAAFVGMLEEFKKDITGSVAKLAERVLVESGMEISLKEAGAEGKDALENLNELITAAAQYDQQTEEPSLVDYLQQISLFSDADAYDAGSERVALMTLHTAKGLEFKDVFIVGVEDGILPHERGADDEGETEEERRLFFVGITRAKSGLFITYARYRTIRGQLLRTIPSPFLYELGIALPEHEGIYQYDGEETDNVDSAGNGHEQFMPGQMVVHKTFGLGTVKEFIDMGPDSIVKIKFSSGQIKTLMLKYAKIMCVDG